ncbi:MAG: energy-coupling factor transporter transmembrane component T [Anaerolineae bacterium]
MMHPLAWLTWLASAALCALVTRNPLYLILLLAFVGLVLSSLPRSGDEHPLRISPFRFAAFAVVVGAVFNALTSHVGETVILHLPRGLPLLGGDITAEALAFGAINGLVLGALFAAFAVLNAAVPVRDLIGYLPRAFYPLAVVSAIAISFVPNTIKQVEKVREAQAVRGHRMRGVRDWLPLFMPVLIGGLERAMQLAETMTARGFAGISGARPSTGAQLASLGGLMVVLAGGIARLLPSYAIWSPFLLAAGLALVIWAVWRAGRRVRRTRYHRHVWTFGDTVVTLGALAAVAPMLIWTASRTYSPYPELTWPAFDLRVGGALLGFMVPALMRTPAEAELP